MDAMRKFLVTVFLATLPVLADDSTKLEIHVTTESGRPIDKRAASSLNFKAATEDQSPNPKFRKEWDVQDQPGRA